MKIRYDRPVSRSAFLARRLALFALAMILVAGLAHRFGPLSTPDFVALALVAAVPAAVSVPLALIGLARLWFVGALGGVAATRALLYAALPLGLALFGTWRYMALPEIYDVTTDVIDPPAFIETAEFDQKWLPRPAIRPEDRREQARAYPALASRRYDGALDRVYEAVVRVAAQKGWRIGPTRGTEYAVPELLPETEAGETELDGAPDDVVPEVGPVPKPRPQEPLVSVPATPEGTVLIQAETRSLVLGFPMDTMIRLREEAETTLVDLRVESRYGPHDLGFGAETAQDFLHALDAELLGIAGD
ncbi:DUF1499 domain-containing protein [Ciceribacter sp. L1K22]|uniref:DUF1499 domain-containing protein n=1 Tax=Ciceribacter sp. L1K22 TaxID=2820275 RepID=UPI001ABE5BEB|nr:DUF1499 domain-containing protein [Ciceribacter sp. L1K22]MBO3759205.1 DUF1499 domain-containing protein [Ciceribacter sp. L1K22]